ncbi:MAG: hypothetical protein QM662_17965 [Gordonia sp. (in: high G+C Gram-positive bacteria)]
MSTKSTVRDELANLFSHLLPGRSEPTTLFGITPSEIESTAQIWLDQAEQVANLHPDTIGDVTGTSSRVMDALRTVPAPAQAAVASIARQLQNMSDALRDFTTESISSDEQAARAFDRLPHR